MTGLEASGEHLLEPCRVLQERVDGTVFVRVFGELDIACQDRLNEVLGQLPGEGDSGIVIDMRGLEFVDSNGLRTLLEHQLRSQQKGFDFALIAPRGHPAKVIQMTGIDQVITILPDPDAPTSDGSKAADRASAGLGTDEPDPGDWLSRNPG